VALRKVLDRRGFLRLSALGVAGTLLAACGGGSDDASDATPTRAPAQPTPEATAAAAVEASATPVDATSPSPTAGGDPASPGASLIGELEGPTIITDESQWPTSFSEAPMLSARVQAGDLPPVEERVPSEPLVIQPVHEIGRYGGTWRRGFTGPADGENGNRINASDKLLFFDYTGNEHIPSVVKSWEINSDASLYTLSLRQGMKWSDGAPFTADDFVFWYEDIYSNAEITENPSPELTIDGQQGTLEKIDETTVAFSFPGPYPLFIELLAGNSQIGGGQSLRQARGNTMGSYAPAHYLKTFHPSYNDVAELDEQAQAEGYDDWRALLIFKRDWQLNPELPTLGPWKTVSPINTAAWTLERNPFYWAVDTEGNQLPYIDTIQMTLAEDLELINLRALAGEYDFQARHIGLEKLPVFLENQERSNFTVYLDPQTIGADTALHVNQTFEADPEIAKWLKTTDFRRALSLGIDRDQLNEIFWLGVGTPGSSMPSEDSVYSPGPEYRTLWSTHDPEQANELLDSIGLTEKDSDGFRLRTDNGERLRVELMTVAAAFLPYTQHAEMIAQQWQDIGIQADVRELERGQAFGQAQENQHHIMLWGSSEDIYTYPRNSLPVEPFEAFMGPAIATWFVSEGAEGTEPDPRMKEALDLYRAASGQQLEERITTAHEIWKILIDEQYSIGTVGLSPAFMGVRIVSNTMGNIPARQINSQIGRTPGSSHPSTFFFKE